MYDDDWPDEDKFEDVEVLDLCPVTRQSDVWLTTISLCDPYGNQKTWIKAGVVRIRPIHRDRGEWDINAFFKRGVTDCEEDSAMAFAIPLIGVEFDRIERGRMWVRAFIDPNDLSSFRIPKIGYTPEDDPSAVQCKTCEKSHLIIEHYLPRRTQETKKLFERIKGKRLEIRTGAALV